MVVKIICIALFWKTLEHMEQHICSSVQLHGVPKHHRKADSH